MTKLTRDANGKILEIPPSITSVEQLEVWCAEVLQNLYPNLKSPQGLDSNGEPEDYYVIESNKFFYTAPTPPEWRHLSRACIGLSSNHQVRGHIWEHAKSFGDLDVPEGMRS